jgi:hypothetical protein
MKFLAKLMGESKDAFLGVMREQLKQLAVGELASGKLKSPANLDEICGRVTKAWRRNPVTGGGLKALKVTDEELRDLLKDVLAEVGVELT